MPDRGVRWSLAAAFVAIASFGAGAVRADDADRHMFVLSGFGTFGVVHSSEDKADFSSSYFKPDGAGFTRSWSASVDSLVGAQLSANLTPKLSAVVQVISEQNEEDRYEPHLEWANIKYQFTPDFSIRGGRTVLPTFLVSDTRKVGYTNPWLRPPLDVYRIVPVTHSDGLDTSYRMHFGEVSNTVQANIGRSDTELPHDTGTAEARNLWGIADTAEYGSLTARVTYLKADLTVAYLNPLFDAFRQFGPQGVEIADKYGIDQKPAAVLAVGAGYDRDSWFVMGEWGRLDSDSYVGGESAWYGSGGYRFSKLTPYVTYAQSKASRISEPGLDLTFLPSPFLEAAMGLNAALDQILSTRPVQNTVSVGVRWDFMKRFDLHLQYDYTDIGDGSSGILINMQPDFQLGGDYNVFSATIDFVF